MNDTLRHFRRLFLTLVILGLGHVGFAQINDYALEEESFHRVHATNNEYLKYKDAYPAPRVVPQECCTYLWGSPYFSIAAGVDYTKFRRSQDNLARGLPRSAFPVEVKNNHYQTIGAGAGYDFAYQYFYIGAKLDYRYYLYKGGVYTTGDRFQVRFDPRWSWNLDVMPGVTFQNNLIIYGLVGVARTEFHFVNRDNVSGINYSNADQYGTMRRYGAGVKYMFIPQFGLNLYYVHSVTTSDVSFGGAGINTQNLTEGDNFFDYREDSINLAFEFHFA